jgi:hypothetical protein
MIAAACAGIGYLKVRFSNAYGRKGTNPGGCRKTWTWIDVKRRREQFDRREALLAAALSEFYGTATRQPRSTPSSGRPA